MEIVKAVIGPFVELVMVPVKKHIGYVVFSESYVTEMSTKMKELDHKGVDIKKREKEYKESNLEIPTHVPSWLEAVEKFKKDASHVSNNGSGCLNVKMRYRVGRKAFKISKEINRLFEEDSRTTWNDVQKDLGEVNSNGGGDTQNDFQSRKGIFEEAKKFLQADNKTQVISLCGMGGVGKTTTMKQLRKAVENTSTFNNIYEVAVGGKGDPVAIIQTAIAGYMRHPPNQSDPIVRATALRKRFEEMSKGQKKVLVILDDLWATIDLNDIGLSPLPNGFKMLLTSRFENVCRDMATKNALVYFEVVRVDVLKEHEACEFFWKIAGTSKKSDPELDKIGGQIVKKCGFLPLAINHIATTLKYEDNYVWRTTLDRLKNNDHDKIVQEVVKISYDYFKNEEAKDIFRICGLFPEDFDIPIEELTRYAWGRKLLKNVATFRAARDRTRTWVRELQKSNLLIASDRPGCVKMHDLVLSFVLTVVSEDNYAWIINHGRVPKWSTSECCKSMSLACTGTSEFPQDLKYPNLSLLKLMRGDESLRFPKDFFGCIEKIEVIAFEKMLYPLLPGSLQCSTNLRTLYFHQCSLMHDISPIGNLLSLEVLSFAHCHIQNLPSAIGNLKRLKLLDLTGSVNLHIDDGVLQNLVELEELYMRAAYEEPITLEKLVWVNFDYKAINFTDANYNELAERSETLSAIEIEFFKNMALLKNLSWKKLERFRISMGCYLKVNEGDNVHSFENTLMLSTNKGEILECQINELFDKAEVIHLEVDGMNDLEDVLIEPMHPPQQSLFYNLRVLTVLHCGDLRYLFTHRIARGLSKLEHLTISSCPTMEVLIHSDNNETILINFQELKFLSLEKLPKLVNLCNTISVIELPKLVELRLDGLPNFSSIYPENKSTSSVSIDVSAMWPFLKKEVLIPKLEKLDIERMENLKQIWPCRFGSSEVDNNCRLRNISVNRCDNLVNLFPSNPMPWLHHLEKLKVEGCGSIEVIFDLDLGCAHEIEECSSNNSLRSIVLKHSGELRNVWRIKGVNDSRHVIRGFQAVREIRIYGCKSFRNVFTPTTANFDLGALEDVDIKGSDHLGESGENNELVESNSNINTNTVGQPGITRTNHVLQFNWNIFLIRQQQEPVFYNLTKITLRKCKNIKYLLSPLAVKLLSNLKTMDIWYCDSMEEVVSNKDDGDEEMTTFTSTHTNAYFFPHFDTLYLCRLPRLKHIGGGNNVIASNVTTNATVVCDPLQLPRLPFPSWSLCQYSTKIHIERCNALLSVIPSYAVGHLQKLEELSVYVCESMLEVFESQSISNSGGDSNNIGEGSFGTSNVLTIPIPIPRMKSKPLVQLCNLRILSIGFCKGLGYIFTFSTLESLKQLKELDISNCEAMEVIVKEKDGEQTISNVVVLPRLQIIKLVKLPNLKGFFMGMNEFQWPSLDEVKIIDCPGMTVFTCGDSKAPKLEYIHSGLGKHSIERGLNFHLTPTTLQQTPFSTSHASTSFLTSKRIPFSFSNLLEVDVSLNDDLRNIIPCDAEFLQVQKLVKIHVRHCSEVVEVFEAFKGENSGLNESQSVVKFPQLREVNLFWLEKLEYIWRNDRWTILVFLNLTTLSIYDCNLLGHVFTCSMVDSLPKLQELDIRRCENTEVIVKEEEEEEDIRRCENTEVIVKEEEEEENRGKEVVFPCLKSLKLEDLKKLKGFCLGKEDFLLPSLHTLEIKKCPEITVFTNGLLTTPRLNVIDTSIGGCYAEENINSFIKVKKQEGYKF